MAVEGSVRLREKKVKWFPGEVDALIAIWAEPNIAESIEKKTTKKKAVWEILATRLHDLGYEVKSADAIKNKIFKIKQHYKKVDEQVGPSGAGSTILQDAPWYYKVHEILKQRPAMQAPPGSIGESLSLANTDGGDDDDSLDHDDSGIVEGQPGTGNEGSDEEMDTSDDEILPDLEARRVAFASDRGAVGEGRDEGDDGHEAGARGGDDNDDGNDDSEDGRGSVESEGEGDRPQCVVQQQGAGLQQGAGQRGAGQRGAGQQQGAGQRGAGLQQGAGHRGAGVQQGAGQQGAGQRGAGQQANVRQPKPRARSDQTARAFSRRLNDIITTSDRRYMAREDRIRQEERRRREEDRQLMRDMVDIMRQNLEMARRRDELAERREGRRSEDMRALMQILAQQQHHPTQSQPLLHQPVEQQPPRHHSPYYQPMDNQHHQPSHQPYHHPPQATQPPPQPREDSNRPIYRNL